MKRCLTTCFACGCFTFLASPLFAGSSLESTLSSAGALSSALEQISVERMAEKQLQAEQERLKVGLSTTRFVLEFQRDLATAQGNELRAIVDYNKSLSNLERHKATTLDRYSLEIH